MSAKKPKNKLESKERDKFHDKIESSQSSDKSKEVGQDQEVKILDEPNQVESPKESRYEFRGNFFNVMI